MKRMGNGTIILDKECKICRHSYEMLPENEKKKMGRDVKFKLTKVGHVVLCPRCHATYER